MDDSDKTYFGESAAFYMLSQTDQGFVFYI